MLKGIHPLLHADLLHALAAMGHGDAIAIVDANFPAAGMARRLLQVAGAGAPAVLDAVLSVLPLDTAVIPAAITMAVVDAPEDIPAPVAEFAAVFTAHGLADLEIGRLPREAFYARAREAFAIVRTGELRGYGNILLVKGVLEERSAHRPGPVR
jgi:L-fucose mutarotase